MSTRNAYNINDCHDPPSWKESAIKYIARQPIFGLQEQVFGYELLFRSGMSNFFDGSDPNGATCSVIADSLLLHGLETLTQNGKAFINFTHELLVNDYVTFLPKTIAVVEILETIEPDAEVLAACRRLKDWGYCLALDDVNSIDRVTAFLPLVDIIKVDLSTTVAEQRQELVSKFAPCGIVMLAEKVETHEDFLQLKAIGFQYFQGYFWSKPQLVSARDVPAFKLNYLRILQAINRPEIDVAEIENVIKSEVAFCYKLLRYLNSACFGFHSKIHSIRHAIMLLGLKEIQRWASLLALAAMCKDKPQELIITSLVRANLCESLAAKSGLESRKVDFFLLGLFSLIDAILDRPLPEILAQLSVSDEIKDALELHDGHFGNMLSLVQTYEQGEWEKSNDFAETFRVNGEDILEMYVGAVERAQQVFQLS